MARITIVDTTLREGARAAGTTLTANEQLRVAEEIAALGVDVVEAGYVGGADTGNEAARRVAASLRGPIVSVAASADPAEIDRAAEALESADRPRIHLVVPLASGDRAAVEDSVAAAVTLGRRLCGDVAFSAADAWGVEPERVRSAAGAALAAGASVVTLADAAGGALPNEVEELVGRLVRGLPELPEGGLGVLCRDDLGLAAAGSLAAVGAGARLVECSLIGLGPRAGVTALEEITLALEVRASALGHETGVNAGRLFRAARLLAYMTGIETAPHKAVVGRDAFSEPAGALGTGRPPVLSPRMVGAPDPDLLARVETGVEGLEQRYGALGYTLGPDELQRVGEAYVELAARKLSVLDEDLISILHHGVLEDVPERFRLSELEVTCGGDVSHAAVTVVEDGGPPRSGAGAGDGPVAATFAALDGLLDFRVRLEDLTIRSATPGGDALGEVTIHVSIDGQTFTGRGAHTDVVRASAAAFLHAVNKAAAARVLEERHITATSDWGV